MSKERKIKSNSDRGFRKIMIATAIGLVIFFIFSAASAMIIMKSNVELQNIKYFFVIALLVAVFVASAIAAYTNRNTKGMIIGLLTSFLVTFIIMLIVVIINSAQITGLGYVLFAFSAIIGIPAGIIGANLKQ